MSAFSYPVPSITVSYDYETLLGQRIAAFVQQWDGFRVLDPDLPMYNVQMLETDPVVIGLEAAAYGDLYFTALANDIARATILVDYATGADLDLHGLETKTPAHPNGVIRHDGEADAPYRARIIEARQGQSAAGPDQWWLTHARSADPRVRSIGLRYLGMGDVRIYVLSHDNGGIPDQEMLDRVTARLNRDDVRPRTAWPTVSSAVIAEVDVVADVWLLPEAAESRLDAIKATALASHTARRALDIDLTHHALKRLLDAPDVYKIEIISPAADLLADPERAWSIRSIDLRLAGRAR
ncbi:baseplate J/gp47 family protein [Castellaniella sp.]|uniref:baseplate J/gp47 family protein n=1 Tax=Castellaniella sp. TaxID=1955812 RepID=UPI002AFDEF4E|nr:baseplate J/gp47 family protein [Castellaniella sp.]